MTRKFVVIKPFVGTFTRGDVVTEAQLASDVDAMVAEKSIREATEWEAQLDHVPAEHVSDRAKQTPPEELVEAGLVRATSSSKPKRAQEKQESEGQSASASGVTSASAESTSESGEQK